MPSEMSNMKISVVITAYNLENYLEEAILSVLNQTRKVDEIIIADDCSTDNTWQIIDKYKANVSCIRQKENAGALRNSLAGLMAAKYDLVAFLDGDDVWMPQKIEKMLPLFEADDNMMIASHDHCRTDSALNETNILDDTNENVMFVTQNFDKADWSRQFRKSIFIRGGYWFGSAYIIKKSRIDFQFFNKIIDENAELAKWSYLDLVMGPFITASNPSGTVGLVNEKLFKYRIHDNSTSGSTADVKKTLNSLKRSQSVNRLTYLMIKDFVKDEFVKSKFYYFDAVHQLAKYQYEGKKFAAIGQFIKISPDLIKNKVFIKELKRLTITTFLGLNKFISLKKKYA